MKAHLAALGLWGMTVQAAPPPSWHSLSLKDLKVTEGALRAGPEAWWSVSVPKLRAVSLMPNMSQGAELRFRYLGPTEEQKALGSGEMRRQIGLKLRAQDGCNVLYAMWRSQPRSELVVSVKRNEGQQRSAECGNRGYQNLRPQFRGPLPEWREDTQHRLRAEWKGANLKVYVDDQLSWSGPLPPEAVSLEGPEGLRTDNGRFLLQLVLLRDARP